MFELYECHKDWDEWGGWTVYVDATKYIDGRRSGVHSFCMHFDTEEEADDYQDHMENGLGSMEMAAAS